jgi:catechol 2,3-dioxygenase-like lactoylglutathione lyase family enzyme
MMASTRHTIDGERAVLDPQEPSMPFGELHHVALVVENVERTVQRLERLGFGPFVTYPPLSEYVELDVPDAGAFYDLRIEVCEIGPVALQVIEGRAGTIYGDFLRERGEGVFHLGFRVDDVDAAQQDVEGRGAAALARGRRADGSGFTYFDTLADLGITLLVRESRSTG